MIADGDRVMVRRLGRQGQLRDARPARRSREARAGPLQRHRGQHRPGPPGLPGPPPAPTTWTSGRLRVPDGAPRTPTRSSPRRSPRARRTARSARASRRGILYRLARELGCTKIALGHHRDDAIDDAAPEPGLLGAAQGRCRPSCVSDDGDNVVIRPLIYCAEAELAAFAAEEAFPIIPCDLCGSQENLQRKAVSHAPRRPRRTLTRARGATCSRPSATCGRATSSTRASGSGSGSRSPPSPEGSGARAVGPSVDPGNEDAELIATARLLRHTA